MILRDGTYYDSGIYNRMIWLLMLEINETYDSVFEFHEAEDIERLNRLKRYLNNKINCD